MTYVIHSLVCLFVFNRKDYTINTTETAPNCSSAFKSSNLDFGSAYTYVIRSRAVSSSSHHSMINLGWPGSSDTQDEPVISWRN